MNTPAERIADGMVGARAALDMLDELLGEWVEEHGDAGRLSVEDVRRLLRAARESIEGE